jgi:hypothetical protein
MTKKTEKTIKLGSIIKGEYGPYISFDRSIKKVFFEREVEFEGKVLKETVSVPLTTKGYLGAANIAKVKDSVDFKLSKGWIDEDQANTILRNSEEYNISSEITIKVTKN